jgi:hypothetical protein
MKLETGTHTSTNDKVFLKHEPMMNDASGAIFMSLDVVWSGASQKQNPEMKEPTGRRIKNRRKMKISKR